MKKTIWTGCFCGAVAMAVAGGTITVPSAKSVVQPIAFNHKRHIEEDLSCTDCHTSAQREPYAGFPAARACLLCHEDELGDHPDEPKVREYAERGVEIPWVQVNRLPGHAYFSHAVHTSLAEMECRVCHGDMEEATEPVTAPQIGHLDMEACMGCHEAEGVSNDCLRCHK